VAAKKKDGEIELPPPVTATCGCVCRVVVGRSYPEIVVVKVCKRHKAHHEELLGKKELEVRDFMMGPKKATRRSVPPKRGRN
jgi:hypothetical protein